MINDVETDLQSNIRLFGIGLIGIAYTSTSGLRGVGSELTDPEASEEKEQTRSRAGLASGNDRRVAAPYGTHGPARALELVTEFHLRPPISAAVTSHHC